MNIKKIKAGSTIMGVLIVIAVIGLIAMSGCIGGGGGDQQKQPSGAEKPAGGEQPAQQPAEENKPAAGENIADKAKKSFSDLFNLGKPQGYTVSYDITAKNAEGMSKMTMYFAGEKKMRIDSTSNYDGEILESSIFLVGDESYMCTKTEGEWTCFKFTSKSESNKWEEMPKELEKDIEKPLYDGTQNIAGINAECYKLDSGKTTSRYCVHPQKYLILLGETYSSGELDYKMIATKVDLSMPKDSVFVPPVEPKDITRMMGEGIPAGNAAGGSNENAGMGGDEPLDEGNGGGSDNEGMDQSPCERCNQLPEEDRAQCREYLECT